MYNSEAETWANKRAEASALADTGLDLHLDLSGTRVRARLENALRDAVRSGRLAAGIRLPSSRTLAGDLGIARNTVAEVYSQLVAEGWLTARTGSGTSVASHRAVEAVPASAEAAVRGPLRYDLRAGEPDVSAFPRGPWLAAARKALAGAPDVLLGYSDPRGLMVLRSALAGYLARVRGVVCEPGNIVICSGFAHGLAIISGALRAAGASTIAVEEFGHQKHRDIVARHGLRLQFVPIDDHGAVIDAFGAADAALLTPAHQFPLGMTLQPRRRRAAARWGGIVIEDDYDGEFRYDRQPVGAMQALAPDNVVYCGTASKSLAPGVRMGWLVVPPRLLDAVTAVLDGGPSALDQLALAEFIESGGYDRQIRRARLAYRRRRDRLVAELASVGLQVSGIAAGMHVVLDFFGITALEPRSLTLAANHGLALDGLRHYAFDDGAGRSGLVIGYARPPEHAYTTTLARLRAVLAELSRSLQIFHDFFKRLYFEPVPAAPRFLSMGGTKESEWRELVIVPGRPPGGSSGDMQLEIRLLADGTRTLPVFSSVARLVDELGPGQPWVCLPMRTATAAATKALVDRVSLDPVIGPGAWKLGPDRIEVVVL